LKPSSQCPQVSVPKDQAPVHTSKFSLSAKEKTFY